MTEAQQIKIFFGSLQRQRPLLSGTATPPVLDSATGRQRYVDVSAAGTTIRVPLSETSPKLAGGDAVYLEQWGSAANAQYRIVDATGARPTAGMLQFFDESTVGGSVIPQGDILLGSTDGTGPHFRYAFADAQLQARVGDTINGSWSTNGTIISGEVADLKPNIQITPTGLHIRVSTTDAITLNVTDGIKMYSDSTQRVWIKPDGSGWLAGSDKIAWDTSGNIAFAGTVAAGGLDVGTVGNVRGGQSAYNTDTGFWIGYVSGDSKYKFSIGTATKGMLWDGDDLRVKGAIITTVGGGTEPALQAWYTSCVFSTTDADTVAWASGEFHLADGGAYEITGGNTGNMTVKTYIYWDAAYSSGMYFQSSSSIADSFGSGKVLVAVAFPGTTAATYAVYGGGASKMSGADIDEASIPSNRLVKTTSGYTALDIDVANDAITIMDHASGKAAFFAGTPVVRRAHIAADWATMSADQWDYFQPEYDPTTNATRINEYDDALTAIVQVLRDYNMIAPPP